MKKKKPRAVRSIEQFNHFRCGYCDHWWGVGDAPRKRQKWYCPWCGKENTYTKCEVNPGPTTA